METVDFGCRVRVLHRRRLAAGTLPSSLNAAEFLASVKNAAGIRNSGSWTQLRLSQSGGLRMTPASAIRKDEGFESEDSVDSDPSLPAGSTGSSGVDMDDEQYNSGRNYLKVNLSDVLSCQNPAALPSVVLLTLRASGADALDVVALECCADETARILTHLFTKLCLPDSSSRKPWVQRMSKSGSDPDELRSKSIRTPSVWNLIQRTDPGGLTHQVALPAGSVNEKQPEAKDPNLSGSQRSSKSLIQQLASGSNNTSGKKKKNSGISGEQSISGSSCIVSMQTPELPLPAGNRNRWIFGVTPRLPLSSSSSGSSAGSTISSSQQQSVPTPPGIMRRGRSVERRRPSKLDRHLTDELEAVLQSQLDHRNPPLPVEPALPAAPSLPATPLLPAKVKRDQSKTRSFLKKFTGRNGTSGSAPEVSTPDPVHPPPIPAKKERGRSLLRLRGASGRTPSVGPPSASASSSCKENGSGQTFLIPTKSGHELTRNIYPKDPYVKPILAGHQMHPHQQPLFHLVQQPVHPQQLSYQQVAAGYNTIHPWYWSDPADAHQVVASANPHWIYYHPAGMQPQQQQQLPMTKAELMRMRSRSQSPGRRWLPATPAAYDSGGSYQPVSLPVTLPVPPEEGSGVQRRRSRSRSGRTPSAFQRSFYRKKLPEDSGSSRKPESSGEADPRKVTFNAFATVQLVE